MAGRGWSSCSETIRLSGGCLSEGRRIGRPFAFDLIAKKCRKYGLFLCLATQMPRNIPVGTLSQMGSFIVHRLINDQDRKVVEAACSSASHSSLAYLPALGPGEALVTGVDFPMPLLLKIDRPRTPPRSDTPKLLGKSMPK